MNDEIEINSTDYWFKIVEFLQQNWGVIEETKLGCIVFFFGDTAGVFDQMEFASVEQAEEALKRNGFAKYEEDRNAQEFITKPQAPFRRCTHPNGSIYSSGKYWQCVKGKRMDICHFNKVDKKNIVADFTDDGLHRLSLTIPLLNRDNNKIICVIGQNPSKANQYFADKTLHYLEKYIFEKMPEYTKIIMLNLYSRIDTKKEFLTDLERPDCTKKIQTIMKNNTDFLIVYGKLKNQGKYKFREKARELKLLLKNKKVHKIDIATQYAPHPGNKNIYYGNFCHGVTDYDFSDIE